MTTRWTRCGALALVMVLASCGGSDATDGAASEPTAEAPRESEFTAASSEAPATAAVEVVPDESAPEQPRPDEPDPVPVYEEDAEWLTRWFTPFDPGTYRTDVLGTSISFTTDELLSTQPNGGGFFVVSDVASRGPDDRDLVFLRITGFADPTDPGASVDSQQRWPATDFLGWLAQLDDGVVATEPEATKIGGRSATYVEITLGNVECGFVPGGCVGFASSDLDTKAFNRGSIYRVWVVDQDDHDPIAVIAGISRDEDAAWFDRADDFLATLAFGEIGPNPVVTVRPEPTELDLLGGVAVTFPDERMLHQMWLGRKYATVGLDSQQTIVDFAETPLDLEGNLIATSSDLITHLEGFDVTLTELEPVAIGGIEADIFDATSPVPGVIAFKTSEVDFQEEHYGWDIAPASRVWMIDHPDRGLLVISAKNFGSTDESLAIAIAWAEELIASLSFVEIG